jgi:PAS domain S-box-containing protein
MTPLPAAAGEPGVQRGPAAPHRGGAPGRSRPPAPPQAADFHHERLELAVEATELGLWEWDIRTGELFWSERQRAIFGVAPQAALSYQSWSDALHPEDRDWVIALVRDLLVPGSTGRLQMEHRVVRPSGEVRWVFANGRMLYEGAERAPARLLGTVFDITDRKRAEEDRQLLLRELNHRVKNLFAVTSGLVALTARSAATPQEMGTALRGRIEALARAHDLLQPAIVGGGLVDPPTGLERLARAILAPFGADRDAITVAGPEVALGPQAATALTLVLHECATNAVKYGALGAAGGTVTLSWTDPAREFVLTWIERGGPPVAAPPADRGFGSKLTAKTITSQLGGHVEEAWDPEGLTLVLRLPLERLGR